MISQQASDGVDASVGFLYRDRDPKKRRVKPVQKHLLQVDFGEDDSAEDSDFKVDPNADSDEEEEVIAGSHSEKDEKSDESDEGDEEEKDDESDMSESDSVQDSDESDNDDRQSSTESDSSEPGGKTQDMLISWGDGDSEDDEDYVPPDQRTDSKPPTPSGKGEAVPHRKEDIKISGEYTQVVTPGKKLKIVICQVCLGDISVEEDEIVECDGCGVSVHEGCYGISENQSAASTESSASTEPWFCDACKAGVEQPHCELCPNPGGIFKETDAGKWVHIVCALYIPGVAFGDVDKLSPVTLFEMSYSKWGAKECSLCEDIKFSRTGVCVGCDAGMCRTYFHVTCAQREGLLSEASPEEDIADPFYAYCKQHAEKHIARKKRCNWLALQRNIKNYAKQEISDEKEKERVQRKLKRHCRKYVEYYAKKPPSWTPTEKMPRLLSSCPSALRRLNRKAELLGINTQVDQSTTNKDTRKKSYVSPAFSVEYVTYFVERNNKISTMGNHTNDLQQQHSKLREQEAILRAKYDQLSNEMTSLRNSNTTLRCEGESFWKILGDMAGKSLGIPEVLKVKKLTVQTSLPRNPAKKDSPTSPNIGVILHKCSLCQKTSDQHMLARCDKCRLYSHLGCLDPPLTRMPKKTKQCGWQCSECAKTSSEESDTPGVNPDAPRKLREMIKEPSKFAPEEERVRYRGLLEACKPKQKGKRRVRVPSEHKEDSDDDQPHEKKKKDGEKKEQKAEKKKMILKEKQPKDAVPKKEKMVTSKEGDKPAAPKRKRKPQVQPSYLFEAAQQLKAPMECVICLKPGDTTNMVRCDECTLCYHYGCLDPPLTKSPKRRGYSWHCAACDPVGRASDYNDKCDDSDDVPHDEKPKRKKAKRTPPTGKASEQKGVKKADGVRTRCKAKGGDDEEKPGEEEEPGNKAGKLKGAVKTEPTCKETVETKVKISRKAATGVKDSVKAKLEDTISLNPSMTEAEQTPIHEGEIKPRDKIDRSPVDKGSLLKAGDRTPAKAGVRVSVSPGKDGLRSRTPTKIAKKELKVVEDSGSACKSGAKIVGLRGENDKDEGCQKADNVELGKIFENDEKVAKNDVTDLERANKENNAVVKEDGKVAKDKGLAKGDGKITKEDKKVTNEEDSGKKMDKIKSIMCSKEVKIVVNRDLGNHGVGKGKNGKSEEAGSTQKRGEGEGNGKTKGMDRVVTRVTEADKVATRAETSESVVTQGSEPERVSTRASGKSGNGNKGVEGCKHGNDDKDKLPDSKDEASSVKDCGKKKEAASIEATPKERTPKKEGSPKFDVATSKKE
ncbi:PHD finger protein 14-like isoform X2 [Lineus longissimus]|uniref:PHD finger protein 14-like isoform X2 n=1 Tax=Lineus longissimus TaxID=88925 RepID=UPI002B4C2A61